MLFTHVMASRLRFVNQLETVYTSFVYIRGGSKGQLIIKLVYTFKKNHDDSKAVCVYLCDLAAFYNNSEY